MFLKMFCGVVVATCVTCSHGLKSDVEKENERFHSPPSSVGASPKPLKNKIKFAQFMKIFETSLFAIHKFLFCLEIFSEFQNFVFSESV